MKIQFIIPLFLIALFVNPALAQTNEQDDPKREIGVRMSSLQNFDFMYKNQKKENKYSRIRLMSFDVTLLDSSNSINSMFLAAAYGREKRFPVTKRISLVKGWELIGAVSANQTDNIWGTFYTGAGLVLGVQYDFNDHFSMSMETIPSIVGRFSYSPSHVAFTGLDFGLGSNKAAISLMYRF